MSSGKERKNYLKKIVCWSETAESIQRGTDQQQIYGRISTKKHFSLSEGVLMSFVRKVSFFFFSFSFLQQQTTPTNQL
jgi:hypothetical protein